MKIYGARHEIRELWLKSPDDKYMPFIPPKDIVDDYKEVYENNNWITLKGRIYHIPEMTFKHLAGAMRIISDLCTDFNSDKNKYIVYQNLKKELLDRV